MADKVKKIEEYLKVKEQMQAFKKLEADLRKELLVDFFGVTESVEGSTSTFAGEYTIKGTFKLTRKIDKEAFMAAEENGELSDSILDCVSWSPSLLKTQMKFLTDEEVDTLEEYIVATPAMPTLEIKHESEL